MKQSSRSSKPLAGTVPNGQDRGQVKSRDGSTVRAVAPSRKAIVGRPVNGDTPYFRFYADSWRARLAGLSSEAQALVLQAAAIGWSESIRTPLSLTRTRWAQSCGFHATKLDAAVAELADLSWITLATTEADITVTIPDLVSQADVVTYERDKKRRQRAEARGEGLSSGRIDRSIDRGRDLRGRERREEPAGVRAPHGPDPATDEQRKAILGAAITKLAGRKP